VKKENSALLKRLQQYSALALPMLATAGLAGAQVVYKDINPDVTLSLPGDSMLLDLNNDGVFDYTFRMVAYTTYWNRACVAPANVSGVYLTGNKNAIIGYLNIKNSGTIYAYASALSTGHAIDDNQPMFVMHDILFTDSGNNLFYLPGMNSVFSTAQYGEWKDGADHFVGFKFTPDDGATFYFGWARCLVSTDAKTMIIKDYAYQPQAGTAIVAGEGINIGIQIPANEDGVKIVMAGHFLNVNFETINFSDTSIRLLNVLGQEVMNRKVTSAQNTIGLKQIPAGTYLVQVNYRGKEISKKIMVN